MEWVHNTQKYCSTAEFGVMVLVAVRSSLQDWIRWNMFREGGNHLDQPEQKTLS